MSQLLIEQRNYTHIPTYVFKADAALDAASASAAKSEKEKEAAAAAVGGAATAPQRLVTTGTAGPALKKTISAEREKVQSKLDFASALSHLGQGNFEKAAMTFLRLGSAEQLGDWMGQVGFPSLSFLRSRDGC